ncbi:hypothetical protein V590_01954 [Staphylococcus aureus H19404]|nr:hypothetical protein V590_01954 [Staphylococcus aureus H19404]
MQVGVWAPTQKLTKSQLTIMCKLGRGPNTENFEKKFYRQCELGCGPQHREIGFPISTDNASWGGGPNTENFEKKFYRQCKLGCGPQHREFRFPISTDNASWGGGPNTENFEKKFYRQCKLGWDDEINFSKISFLSHSHHKRRYIRHDEISSNLYKSCKRFTIR